ncbi:MAG TPA: tRNA dihydrouridine(20/20a) synthase DusA [Pseudomonadales bacterium]
MHHNRFDSHRLCIAPMLDWTDRHARFFLRLISPHARLYTEMVTSNAIIHGDAERHLAFDHREKPLALQLGGSQPEQLYRACRIAGNYPYDEINLNVGCPSDRVQSGRFGACLMADPALVADCVKAMQQGSDCPITVKCRIGIDEQDDMAFLQQFIETVSQSGCNTFIIHARKAWLSGLSPKENREIPPLHYHRVYAIKQHFPALNIVINGGITDARQSLAHLAHCDGVMIGREAYQNPYHLCQQEALLFGNNHCPGRRQIADAMLPYIEQQLQAGARLHHITRHMLGLFAGQPGGKAFRRYLSQHAHRADAGPDTLLQALALVHDSSSL